MKEMSNKICFLGAGNIAEAFISCFINANIIKNGGSGGSGGQRQGIRVGAIEDFSKRKRNFFRCLQGSKKVPVEEFFF